MKNIEALNKGNGNCNEGVLIKFKEMDVLDDLSWSCVKGESCKQKPE